MITPVLILLPLVHLAFTQAIDEAIIKAVEDSGIKEDHFSCNIKVSIKFQFKNGWTCFFLLPGHFVKPGNGVTSYFLLLLFQLRLLPLLCHLPIPVILCNLIQNATDDSTPYIDSYYDRCMFVCIYCTG